MRLVLTLFLVLIIGFPIFGQDDSTRRIESAGFTINLPPGWIPVKSSEMEMLIRSEKNQKARLSILRFEIDQNQRLTSRNKILEAIEGLYSQLGIDSVSYDDIKLTLDQNRAVFNVDYIENGTDSTNTFEIALYGEIVRSVDDYQIFFLLRGYTPADADQSTKTELQVIINSFTITLPLADSLFPTKSGYGLLILFFAITLMAFFYLRNRRVQQSRNPLGRDSDYFWRCPGCQLANHIDHNKCQRCGTERVTADKSG